MVAQQPPARNANSMNTSPNKRNKSHVKEQDRKVRKTDSHHLGAIQMKHKETNI